MDWMEVPLVVMAFINLTVGFWVVLDHPVLAGLNYGTALMLFVAVLARLL